MNADRFSVFIFYVFCSPSVFFFFFFFFFFFDFFIFCSFLPFSSLFFVVPKVALRSDIHPNGHVKNVLLASQRLNHPYTSSSTAKLPETTRARGPVCPLAFQQLAKQSHAQSGALDPQLPSYSQESSWSRHKRLFPPGTTPPGTVVEHANCPFRATGIRKT